jgi:hypothetical protein
MDLKKPYQDFKGKYGKFGFDPKGKLLYLGKSRNNNVWLAMGPLMFFKNSGEDIPAGHVTGDTRLSMKHYRMIVMFLAHLVYCFNLMRPCLVQFDVALSFGLFGTSCHSGKNSLDFTFVFFFWFELNNYKETRLIKFPFKLRYDNIGRL